MAGDYRELLGHEVTVQNPQVPSARWAGRAIAIVTEPSVLIEQPDGFRVVLPIEWADRAGL